jgi:hypothetical protein
MLTLWLSLAGASFWGTLLPGPYRVGLRVETLTGGGGAPIQVVWTFPTVDEGEPWTLGVLIDATCESSSQPVPPSSRSACRRAFLDTLAQYGRAEATIMDRRIASASGVIPVADRRPLIVFDAGLRSDALSYFALAEFLSSHGYICVSAPSLPFAPDKPLTLDEAGIRWKADQIGRVVRLASQHSSVDSSRVGLAAWSVGGVTTAIVAKPSGARALISLDGGLGYDYGPPLARRVLGTDSILEVPTLHVTGTAANPSPVPKTFAAFDSATVSHVYRAEIAAINHSHFVAHGGVIRYSSETSPDAARFWRANEALARLVLLFANAFIAERAPAAEFAARASQLSPDVLRIVR